MQLILESETILSDATAMSKIEEEDLSEKVVANCIGELKCIGNKENVGQDNIIMAENIIQKDCPTEETDNIAKILTSADPNDKNENIGDNKIDNLQKESHENGSIELLDNSENIYDSTQDLTPNEQSSTVEEKSPEQIQTSDDVTQIINNTQETNNKSGAPNDTVNQICDSDNCENTLKLDESSDEKQIETHISAIDDLIKNLDEEICVDHDQVTRNNIDQESTDPIVTGSDLISGSAQIDCHVVALNEPESNKQNEPNLSNESTKTKLESTLEKISETNNMEVDETEHDSNTKITDTIPPSESESIVDQRDINDEITESLKDLDNTVNIIETNQIVENSDGEAKIIVKSDIAITEVSQKVQEIEFVNEAKVMEVEQLNTSSKEIKMDVSDNITTHERVNIINSNNKTELMEVIINEDSSKLEINNVVVNEPAVEPVPKKMKLCEADNIDEEKPKTLTEKEEVNTSKLTISNDLIDVDEQDSTPETCPDTTVSANCKDVPIVKNETNVENIKSIIIEDQKNTDESSIIPINLKDDMDVEEVTVVADDNKVVKLDESPPRESSKPAEYNTVKVKPISKLSNMLDILSDDEEVPCEKEITAQKSNNKNETVDKTCINIEEDDDIMLIDEEVTGTTEKRACENIKPSSPKPITGTDSETGEEIKQDDELIADKGKDSEPTFNPSDTMVDLNIQEEPVEKETVRQTMPMVPENFLKTAKKSIADMTREELEEFCVLKIVESVVERSNLGEIKTKLKTMAQSLDEYKKKAIILMKQNRDLQVILKSVQEEQKKMSQKDPKSQIVPLKITRSVGIQVLMIEKTVIRKKAPAQQQAANSAVNANQLPKPNPKSPTQSPKPQKTPANNLIPVPRLVPANSPAPKSATAPGVNVNTPAKANANATTPNGIKPTAPPQPPKAEKRPHNRIQSVTVDLTDDEPPAKMITRNSPVPPVRVVATQNLMQQKQTFAPTTNSPRKVYIPISGPQAQTIRPGQTIMLKTMPGIRQRGPAPQMARMSTPARMNRVTSGTARHPAPLPALPLKQYQPPNWKALPPAPDLRLSKVENGIVISWKIDGYQEDSYEEIASYQLYAYQETASPPSTLLWKKIGDVKALPLPMACTLTQFMAGFKYYFAVRAVDVKSRLGPFSLPGSILLLNKL